MKTRTQAKQTMTDSHDQLSPDRAAAVWRRAAQLQAEAAQRLDERSRALAVRGDPADADPHDFTLDEVRAAALEAGIAPEFVALAVTEMRNGDEEGLSPAGDRAATRYLGVSQRSLELTRTIERPAAQVYDAMQRVLPGHPWFLTLSDSTGDPLAGGILTFDLPEYTAANMSPFAYHATTVDVKQVQVMLRPAPGSNGQACEVVVSAGLAGSVRRNLKVGGWLTGVFTILGGGGGAGVAAAAGLAGAAVALPVAAGAAAVGGAMAAGYRVLFRYSLRKLTEELGRMLQGVDVNARTGGAFAAPRPPGLGPGGDGGATAALMVATTIT
ncbi:MAG TPA: hypothetical protein VE871_06995 [Longimicrobium sp.]|nr:hypothetical protein [Longimicrobium sp.]